MDIGTENGFLLTRHWRDTRGGTEIELWFATPFGVRRVLVQGQRNVAFARAQDQPALEKLIGDEAGYQLQVLPLKTFEQAPVLAIYSHSYRALLNLEQRGSVAGIDLFEADIRPDDRYLMERFITAAVSIERSPEVDAGTLINPRLRPVEQYRPTLKLVSLDIETSAAGEVYSVALEGCGQRQVYMLGESAAAATGPEEDFELSYVADRGQLITALNHWFRHHDPDVIIGWNLIQFDLRLLQACADREGLILSLGRAGQPIEWRDHRRRDGFVFASIPGRVAIDGIEALRSAMWSFPSFALEAVAQELLGEGKAIDDAYHRMAEIERRFVHDKPALARYNLKDCELVTRIFAKTGLMEFLLERAHVTGLQIDRTGGSIAAFSHLYLPRMHRLGYVAPRVGARTGVSYPGGFVLESTPGLYDSMLVLDYKSLYPSIIRTFLIDPVGLAEGRMATEAGDTVPGPNGTRFSRTRHCLPGLITQLWIARDAAKRERNAPLAQALKLLMNAFIGVLGAQDGRFFDPALISAVTLRGHEIMLQTRRWVEAEGYAVVYGDTDSIFISLGRRMGEAEAAGVAAALVERINRAWSDHLRNQFEIESFLEIEFDTHYQRFFMPTIRGSEQGSKKRYAGLVVDEGGAEELVFRGLETVRSDWTPVAKRFQRELFQRIFHDQPYEAFVRDYVHDLRSGRFDDELVYRKRLRGRLESYDRTTPPQVRAARLADEHNLRLGRPLQYQNGGWISYVMTLKGPQPLELAPAVIDHEHYVAHQLRPIAEAILWPLGGDFDHLVSQQAQLF
ncbi:DNA polymerase II [Frateuria aurantia]